MADPVHPLVFVEGDAAGICGPEAGVCALPESDMEPGEVLSEPR